MAPGSRVLLLGLGVCTLSYMMSTLRVSAEKSDLQVRANLPVQVHGCGVAAASVPPGNLWRLRSRTHS